jgi:hypothetical protein
VLDGLLLDTPALLVGCACALLVGVMTDVMTTTAGVSPATVGVGVMVMVDVCTWVTDGGADEAVKVLVVSLFAGGGFELAGGAAEDCGGGAALDAGGGAADDCAGGGLDDGAGAWDEGAGAEDEGGSAEEGGLDCAAAGEEGAGAGEEGAGAAVVSADGVTDGKGADEAAGGEGADCAAGLEGATKEETNVLAVPLLDMVTTIAERNGAQNKRCNEGDEATRNDSEGGETEAPQQRQRRRFQRVRMLVSRIGSQRLGRERLRVCKRAAA